MSARSFLRTPVAEITCLLFLTSLLLSGPGVKAQGNLMFYPKRIVFDGAKRSQDLSIANNGNDTTRYIISVIQIKMNEDGSFQTISAPELGQNFADKNFRFFPRSVVLPPHEAQTVKVQLLKFSNLAPGEYRSHLYFRAEEEKRPLANDRNDIDEKSISISLKPIYGVSIPVIIRSGESNTETRFSDLDLKLDEHNLPTLGLSILRSGNMSLYGDITVNHISPEGKETLVAQVKGVAVYTPNTIRHFTLKMNPNVNYQEGALHIVFKDYAGRVIKYTQKQINL
jgi:hypothetical protein